MHRDALTDCVRQEYGAKALGAAATEHWPSSELCCVVEALCECNGEIRKRPLAVLEVFDCIGPPVNVHVGLGSPNKPIDLHYLGGVCDGNYLWTTALLGLLVLDPGADVALCPVVELANHLVHVDSLAVGVRDVVLVEIELAVVLADKARHACVHDEEVHVLGAALGRFVLADVEVTANGPAEATHFVLERISEKVVEVGWEGHAIRSKATRLALLLG